ncbi:MAG: hypothetical protein KDD47_19365 [Acidobacteria bacterium]|nr:hypothetical protein [Acidobacteriota bacterium]
MTNHTFRHPKTLAFAALLALAVLLPALPAAAEEPVACAQELSQELPFLEPALGTVTQAASCNSNQCYLACVRKGYFSGYCLGGTCVCQQNPSGLEQRFDFAPTPEFLLVGFNPNCIPSSCNKSCLIQGYDFGTCSATGCTCRYYV